MVGALHRAGAHLLAGTDSGINVTQPGSSLHDELAELAASGLTVPEVLRTATTNAAEFLGAVGDIGMVAPGARADLVVVESNPLVDLSALRTPPTVVLRGKLYQRQ